MARWIARTLDLPSLTLSEDAIFEPEPDGQDEII